MGAAGGPATWRWPRPAPHTTNSSPTRGSKPICSPAYLRPKFSALGQTATSRANTMRFAMRLRALAIACSAIRSLPARPSSSSTGKGTEGCPFSTTRTRSETSTPSGLNRAHSATHARGRNLNSQARLFSGFEFNLVKGLKGLPCGTPVDDPIRKNPLENRCTLDYVAPRVDVDYYSYSSRQSMDVKFQGPDPSYKNAYKTDLTFAMNLIRQRRPEITEANFIIGEWGIHRTRWGETTVGNFFNEMLDAFDGPDAFKVSYAIFWQIIDNSPYFGSGEDGFGLFHSRNGVFSITRAGETFKRRLAGQSVEKWTCRE